MRWSGASLAQAGAMKRPRPRRPRTAGPPWPGPRARAEHAVSSPSLGGAGPAVKHKLAYHRFSIGCVFRHSCQARLTTAAHRSDTGPIHTVCHLHRYFGSPALSMKAPLLHLRTIKNSLETRIDLAGGGPASSKERENPFNPQSVMQAVIFIIKWRKFFRIICHISLHPIRQHRSPSCPWQPRRPHG